MTQGCQTDIQMSLFVTVIPLSCTAGDKTFHYRITFIYIFDIIYFKQFSFFDH